MLYFAEILLSGINAACFKSFRRNADKIYNKIEDVMSNVSKGFGV